MDQAPQSAVDEMDRGSCFTGVALGQLAMGLLGALVMTSEYSAGMIRATLAARVLAVLRYLGS
jgi:hypothetical protein